MDIPKSSYRLQFNSNFGFKEAKEIIPYLSEMGISTIYASPILKAVKGSSHCYDVVDTTKLNPDLGTEEEFDELIKISKKYKMSWIQDIVPNHMAYHSQNVMLMDIFEKGKNSIYYNTFDINWDEESVTDANKVLAPFLGGFYSEVLENGEIYISYCEAGFSVNYYDMKFPLKIETYSEILKYKFEELEKTLGKDNSDYIKYLGILYVLENINVLEDDNNKYSSQINFVKKMLWELYNTNKEIKKFIESNINNFNGIRGNSETFDLIDNLLSMQNFRLSFWKVGTEEINYRRFFYVNGLISLKIEDEKVFDYTHSLIFDLINENKISGLRIDHIDGLYDPTEYIQRLRKVIGDKYIVVEKILEKGEELPSFWHIQGTTGYDFLNKVNSLYCKKENKEIFEEIYINYIKNPINYFELVYKKKKLIIEKHMTGDIDNLANSMKRIVSRYRYGNDVTIQGLKRAIIEIIAFFGVYRTYINHEIYSDNAREYIKEAILKAKKRNPDLALEFKLIEWFFFLKHGTYIADEEKKEWVDFIMKFQQFTGPMTAKGIEDTSFYIYNKLISLNEVGGRPEEFGIEINKFHNFIRDKSSLWPYAMNTTSTHDVKRGEDVRARINVLSEIPNEWNKNLKKWNDINDKERLNGVLVPTKNDEYFYYQTLIGTIPFEGITEEYKHRIKDYMIKAVREAKIHTEWLKPDTYYEEAYLEFIEKTLNNTKENQFLKELYPFCKKISSYGVYNSISQLIIKINVPGISDFYQGSELWEFTLVDPDNRNPIDYDIRKKYLKDISSIKDKKNKLKELLKHKEDGKIKMFITKELLNLKKENSLIYEKGNYIPLEVKGEYKNNIIAFTRSYMNKWIITIVPRFLTEVIKTEELPLGKNIWKDTYIEMPQNTKMKYIDAISKKEFETEDKLYIGDIFEICTGAVLESI